MTQTAQSKADFPSQEAFTAAAWMIDCPVEAIRAVARVEAGREGAFLSTGEPVILYERHLFSRLTGGKFDRSHPDLSIPKWSPKGYGKYSEQHGKLARATKLDREAALKSCSWGLFQVLGSNHKATGHSTVQSFVTAMYRNVDEHLRMFVFYIYADDRLLRAIRELDWTSFARVYNGPAFATHNYHGRIAEAFVEERKREREGVIA